MGFYNYYNMLLSYFSLCVYHVKYIPLVFAIMCRLILISRIILKIFPNKGLPIYVIELSSSDGTVEEEVIGQRRKISFMIEILDITTSQKNRTFSTDITNVIGRQILCTTTLSSTAEV